MGALAAGGARVLLAGCGTYSTESGLEDVAAVRASVRDLGQALVERCGLGEANLRIVLDPQEPGELGRAVAEEIGRRAGVLWFHYVGHGLVSPSGQLHLATGRTRTEPGWLAHTALPYASVRDSLLLSSADALVVTLDCCFSGHAVGFLGPGPEGLETDLAQIDGGFVLAAAAREELALAPKNAVHTAFTGELIRLLRQGDPQAGPQLTLLGTARSLQRTLGEQGFPVPRQRASGRAGDMVLCANPAYRPPADSGSADETQSPEDTGAGAVCPYPGLGAFGPEQAAWFFGRRELLDRLTTQLAQRMDTPEPLVVIGPSGAGKSSLLGAGLIPALGRGDAGLPGSATWPHVRFSPTGRPVAALAAALARLGAGEKAEDITAVLSAQPELIGEFVEKILKDRAGGRSTGRTRLVMIVDQFEEVFALCGDRTQRQTFIGALSAAAKRASGAGGALVVLGVRADFYAECLARPELEQALGQAVVVGPMTQNGLAEAITAPAGLCGLRLQSGLVEIMLRDLGLLRLTAEVGLGEEKGDDREAADAGVLPLLAHALQAVWERRKGKTLTLAGYRAAGGIHGAIAATADACYRALETEGLQELAQTLLLRLIQVTDKTETRRRMRPADLLVDLPLPDATVVLDALTEARLITRDTDAVEIAHEVLIRAWPRLRTWVEDDRAGLLIRQRLAAAARLWQDSGRKESELRQQTVLLRQEVAWAARSPAHLRPTVVEQDFLNASMTLDQRRARTRRAWAVGGSLLLVLALVAGLLALQRSQALAANQRQAAARNIAARADTLRQFDPPAAMLLNIAAWKTAQVPETRSGLLTAAVQQDQDTFSLPNLSEPQIVLSGDSRVVMAVDAQGTAHAWNVAAKKLTHKFDVSDDVSVRPDAGAAVINFNGRVTAVQSGEGVRLWDVDRGRQMRRQTVGDQDSTPLALDDSGQLLALTSGRHVEVWDTVTHRRLLQTPGPATTAELSHDGHLALCDIPQTGDQPTALELWDVRTRRSISRSLTSSVVCEEGSLHFSPDGKQLAAAVFTSGTSAGQFMLWDTDTGHTGGLFSAFHILGPGYPSSISVAFSPDGTRLAVSDDQAIKLASLSGQSPDQDYLLTNEEADFMAFAPDGHTLRFLRGINAGLAVRSIDMDTGAGHAFSTAAGASAISANGRVVAVQSPEGRRNKVRIIAPSTGRAIGQALATQPGSAAVPENPGPTPMALSSDGRLLMVADPTASTAAVWDTQTRRRESRLVFSDPLTSKSSPFGSANLLLSADGTVATAALGDGTTVQALQVNTGAEIRTIRHVAGRLLALSSDGRLLVTDAGEVIDVPSGRIRRVVLARYGTATQAAFSPDGSLLAATDYAGGLALWNSTATERLTYLDDGNAYSYGNGMLSHGGLLAFSADGRQLAAQQPLAPKATLWDTHTFRALGAPLPLYPQLTVSGLAFDASGKNLRAVGAAASISWTQSATRQGIFLVQTALDPDVLVATLCKRVGHDLPRTEWALYIQDLPYRHVCT
ncbi:NACHT and WD repeat domain-containing protein [Streptomyces sp. NPDC007157]|uniref:NACHT and WD repeat domain-containing protein n=1 Tax=Streptomyces sp. NPDC007157 TaxID=3154681 RepID=UPI0033C0A85B